MREQWFSLNWPAPATVRALQTTRLGGTSSPPYDSLNLGAGVDDDPARVEANRERLQRLAALPSSPVWLRQVHGVDVVAAHAVEGPPEADASWTDRPGVVCAVLTADCLPVLFCDRAGRRVAAAHAGWRGLAAGVLERTVEAMAIDSAELFAWLGPAIGRDAFEVGDEVRDHFLRVDPGASAAFRAGHPGHWYADLFRLARRRLNGIGVRDVLGGEHCTVSTPELFYSHRRDGRRTGRMASLVWLEE